MSQDIESGVDGFVGRRPSVRITGLSALTVVLALGFGRLYASLSLEGTSAWASCGSKHPVFNSDSWRWIRHFAENDVSYHRTRTRIHPLVVLGVNPWGSYLSRHFFEDNSVRTARFLACCFGGGSVGLSFWVFWGIRRHWGDAFLLACLLGISHAMLTFGGMIEVHCLGLLSTLPAFLLLTLGAEASVWKRLWIAAGLASFSVTLTNLGQGMVAYFFSDPGVARTGRLQRTGGWLVRVLGIGLMLALIQKHMYPMTRVFLQPSTLVEELPEISGGAIWTTPIGHLVTVTEQFGVLCMVGVRGRLGTEGVSLQNAGLADLIGLGRIAGACWLGLVAWAIHGILKEGLPRVGVAIVAAWGLVFAMHLFYGKETFLYAAGFVFYPIGFIASSPRVWSSWVFRTLLVLTVVLLGIHNFPIVRGHWTMACD